MVALTWSRSRKALVVACTWLTEGSLKCTGHRDPCGMRLSPGVLWNENHPGVLAQGVVLACGCSAARAGPCGDPSAPTASRDTRRFQIAKRVARQLARGTGRSYRRSGVCPCVPVWVSIIWCPVRTRKHTRPRRCIPRVGACIPPSLCTPRPPSAELRAETQIGLRLLGSYIDRGGRCHQSSFVAMFRLYRVSAFAMSMRFD